MIRMLWAAPVTLLGLLIAALLWALAGFSGTWAWRSPALSFHNTLTHRLSRIRLLNVHALCIGQVILARDEQSLASAWAHECVHVRQTLRWGPLFPLLYCGHALWCAMTHRHWYWDNRFEMQARAAEDTKP